MWRAIRRVLDALGYAQTVEQVLRWLGWWPWIGAGAASVVAGVAGYLSGLRWHETLMFVLFVAVVTLYSTGWFIERVRARRVEAATAEREGASHEAAPAAADHQEERAPIFSLEPSSEANDYERYERITVTNESSVPAGSCSLLITRVTPALPAFRPGPLPLAGTNRRVCDLPPHYPQAFDLCHTIFSAEFVDFSPRLCLELESKTDRRFWLGSAPKYEVELQVMGNDVPSPRPWTCVLYRGQIIGLEPSVPHGKGMPCPLSAQAEARGFLDEARAVREEIEAAQANWTLTDILKARRRNKHEPYRQLQPDGSVRVWYRSEVSRLPDFEKAKLKKQYPELWAWYIKCPYPGSGSEP